MPLVHHCRCGFCMQAAASILHVANAAAVLAALAHPAPAPHHLTLYTGDKLQLQGLKAYDAAVHCASLSSKPTASAANHGCSKSERRSFASRMLQRLYSNLRTVM